MVFHPPERLPKLPPIPDSITLEEFMSNEQYGRYPLDQSRSPYTCGLTGKTYSAREVKQRVDFLARGIGKRLGFQPHQDTAWDRVVALFSLNTIDYIPFTHAVHRLNGIVAPASAAYSASELEHQLRSSGAKALFTCTALLDTARKAAKAAGLSEDNIFILPMADDTGSLPHTTVDELISQGRQLPPTPPLQWTKGQGARQVAYLCYSSGTSGLPKAVMISHTNIISNVLAGCVGEAPTRDELGITTQVALGLLPLSHIYGLTVVALVSQYRGDEVVVLPKFEIDTFLQAVDRFKIRRLNIVPPILISMMQNEEKCRQHDLSSVKFLYSGAAPLGKELVQDALKRYPQWRVGQGYGMTEASPLVTSTDELDIDIGSSGSLVPGTRAKIVTPDGQEVTAYDTPGEMLVQGPSVVLGYLHSERANAETFIWDDYGRWLRTGDEVVVRKSAQGNEHWVVVDRIKELIKVKGHQVAPAELEAHLLTHPAVYDCAVIPIQDPRAGEVPKAYVVKVSSATAGTSDEETAQALEKHVQDHKANHKWLRGGVEFVDAIPKSASGKILRKDLKERERVRQRQEGAKL